MGTSAVTVTCSSGLGDDLVVHRDRVEDRRKLVEAVLPARSH
jgi:hypothetical protein